MPSSPGAPALDEPPLAASSLPSAPAPAPTPASPSPEPVASIPLPAPAAPSAPSAEPLLPVPDIPVARPQFAPGLPQLPDGQREVAIDLEDTRLVSRAPRPASWVLQFSTGESFTVSGSGLIGRNPSAQPAEFMDQLVPLFDAGKSVSKTHLEFGQDSGRFWVSDRYSTNGTVIRPPDSEPRRCEPGRRYLVSRGTRVDIGEQFFVVS
ncbi:FHA domain-containing protein [Schumannella soli]|uniref:FHA domain-containing protein n=2 Tax=Schumannella soli TaxID=2590779 RepID=A0A506Y3W0_9MICO|nr:FHA domain-containing protein [Schumannella soli]